MPETDLRAALKTGERCLAGAGSCASIPPYLGIRDIGMAICEVERAGRSGGGGQRLRPQDRVIDICRLEAFAQLTS
jgi:hypothetical protein